jgi:hypothetical protein
MERVEMRIEKFRTSDKMFYVYVDGEHIPYIISEREIIEKLAERYGELK